MHFIKKLIHDQVIEVLFFPTEDQVADIFTKSITEEKFSKLQSMLGVQEVVIKGVLFALDQALRILGQV